MASAPAANLVWTNSSGGNWNVSANWSPNQVPGASDNAFITADGTYTVTVDAAGDVNILNVGGATGTQTLSLSAQTLVVHAAGTVGTRGILVVNGGSLKVTGDLTIDSQLNWSEGTISGVGRTILSAGAVTILGTAANKGLDAGRILENHGTVTWTGGSINLNVTDTGGSGRIENAADGLFDIQTDGQISATSFLDVYSPEPRFSNAGTLRKSVGGNTAGIYVNFLNSGTVDIQTGTLRLWGGGSNTGTIHLASLATFAPQSLIFDAGSQITGDGEVLFDTGIQVFNIDHALAHARLTGGTIAGAATLTITNFIWTGGTMSDAGRTIVAASGAAMLNGSDVRGLDAGRVFENRGALTWAGGSLDLSAGTTDGSGRIENAVGAVFDFTSDALLFASPFPDLILPAPRFDNAGTLRQSGGIASISVPVSSSGTIEILAGSLNAAGGFTATANGTVRFVVRGVAEGADYGTLQLDGGGEVAGNLAVSFANGFSPQVAQFPVINSLGGITGFFTFTSGQSLGGGQFLYPACSANSVTIVATSAAATLTAFSKAAPGKLALGGIVGQSYRIDGSTNLVNWVSLATNTVPASAASLFTDPQGAQLHYRFYRAQLLAP